MAISIFSNTKSHDNTSNNAVYKTKLEFKSPSISAHSDILQMRFYPLV